MARTIVLAALLLGFAAPSPCRSQNHPGDSGVGAAAPSYAASLKPEHSVLPPDGPSPEEKLPAVATIRGAVHSPQPSLIVIGFAGGFVRRNSFVHGEVELAEHLRKTYGATIHAEIFENHRGQEAYREILRLVGGSNSGALGGGASNGGMTESKKKAARIVLYGHSWGASEAVAMARQLERDGVPVLLVVQVDGVPKLGEDDGVIPANVAQAINFYQTDGFLHGRPRIRAADPAATRILGNFRVTYKDSGIACPGYPWYTRAFTKPHIEIENDPRVWRKVEALILAEATP
jgi:hypothetical protein